MKLAVLTTETKHHTYFINKLANRFDVASIVYERRRLKKPYPTESFFASREDAFEEAFFDVEAGGTASSIPPRLHRKMVSAHSVNQPGLAEYLAAFEPSIILTFGVGLVARNVFEVAAWGAVNVHRGLARWYRGLDSDLWPIYEGHFDRLGVTLHYLDSDFDTGDILSERTLELSQGDEIWHLRYLTTVMATDMMVDLLAEFESRGGAVSGRTQEVPGPYYSAMSSDQKVVCGECLAEWRNG